ncbi:MAG: ribosome biogenesis GTPase Der [Chitinophagales bacterium]
MGFTVAIVGRPNVGKSTLFNRLIGQRASIVDDESGVTRDRKYGMSVWNGKTFNVIDTGGFVPNSNDIFEKAIREQVAIAIEEASLIVFVVDVLTGITDLDDSMANLLRRSDKTVIVAVNKVDNNRRILDAAEFYSLGFEENYFLSSINGTGTGELLDAVTAHIAEEGEEEPSELPKFAIIGQPNVGKSSLLNALLGETRNIVTNIAGTTRDTTHTHYNMYQKEFLLIDTAGIRKKSKVHENLEFYSVMRAIKAMDEADVCIIVIDAQMGIEAQDMSIFRLAVKKKKGIVILINKWDLIEKDSNTINDYKKNVLEKFAPFTDIPIIFISALYKQRIFKAIETAIEVQERRMTKIPTSQLNEVMLNVIEKHNPPAIKGRYVKIKYVTQLPVYTPTFAFFCNYPRYIKEPYKNYLENQLRQHFSLTGVPISLFFRKK